MQAGHLQMAENRTNSADEQLSQQYKQIVPKPCRTILSQSTSRTSKVLTYLSTGPLQEPSGCEAEFLQSLKFTALHFYPIRKVFNVA